MRASTFLLFIAIVAVGCGDDDTPTSPDGGADAATPSGAVARFELPSAGAVDLLAVPFPSDLYLGADGTLDIGAPAMDSELGRAIVETLNGLDGACRSCPIAFGIDGELDTASVPSDAGPSDSASPTDAVVMMRVDGTDGLLPIEVDWSPIDDVVAVRAAGLRVLPPRTTYVVALTDALLGADGSPLQPTALFASVRDAASGPTPEADRARAVIGPALDALEAAGVGRARVVSAAVLTTRDTGAHLRQLADVVAAAPTPVATVERVYRASDGTLDDLLGTPAMALPGRDNAAAAGTEGDFAIVHDAMDIVVLGRFEAPRVVEGTGTDVGFVRRGADGAVQAGPQEEVPFALVIPAGADVTSLPIAIAHTGLPGSRAQALLVGNTLAAEGIATLSTDPFQMGARAASATDERHETRGAELGPDGLSEHDAGDVGLRFQGVSGVPAELVFHPGFAHGAGSQIVSDAIAALRFVQEGDLGAVAAEDAALAGLSFDPNRILWLGLSFGSWTGMSVVTARQGVSAAVFNVGPGSLVEVACHSPQQRPAVGVALPLAGIVGTFDERERRLCMNPILALYRYIHEDVEPVSALHYLFDAPLHGGRTDVLFQYAGYDENIANPAAEIVLGAAGVPVGGDPGLSLAPIERDMGPFSANVETPNGTITAGGWYFEQAGHVMLIQQREESTVETPVLAPFVPRAAPIDVDNPIVAVHAQIAAFFRSHLADGRATIAAPP